jgi:hypothetical protein
MLFGYRRHKRRRQQSVDAAASSTAHDAHVGVVDDGEVSSEAPVDFGRGRAKRDRLTGKRTCHGLSVRGARAADQ